VRFLEIFAEASACIRFRRDKQACH
jgi:hypothetical protein